MKFEAKYRIKSNCKPYDCLPEDLKKSSIFLSLLIFQNFVRIVEVNRKINRYSFQKLVFTYIILV